MNPHQRSAWALLPLTIGVLLAVPSAYLGRPVWYVAVIVVGALVACVIVRSRVVTACVAVAVAVAIAAPALSAGSVDQSARASVLSAHDTSLTAALANGRSMRVGDHLVVVTDTEVRVMNARSLHVDARIATSRSTMPQITGDGDLLVTQDAGTGGVLSRYSLSGHRQWSVPAGQGRPAAATDDTVVFSKCTRTCRWTAIDADGHRAWSKKGKTLGTALITGVRGDRLPEQLVVRQGGVSSPDRTLDIHDVDTGRRTASTPSGTPVLLGRHVVLLRSDDDLSEDYSTEPPATMIAYRNGQQVWKSTRLESVEGDDAVVVDGKLYLPQSGQVALKDGAIRPLHIPDGQDYAGRPTFTPSAGELVVTGEDSESSSRNYGSGHEHGTLVGGASPDAGRAWTSTFDPEDDVTVHPGAITAIGPRTSKNPFVTQSEREDRLRLRVISPETGTVQLDTLIANQPYTVIVPAPGRLILVGRTATVLHY